MPTRVLIVDDEPLARERLRTLLAEEDDFQVAGECESGKSALAFLNQEAVDLVFLDVVMPEMDGFQVARTLSFARMPRIIFVTVFDTYTLQAFEVHAIDYLLKPVDPARFKAAVHHVRLSLGETQLGHGWAERVAGLLCDLNPPDVVARRLVCKMDGEIVFLQPDEIIWVESAGNYVMLHLNSKDRLVRETLSSMEERLNPFGFVRLSRSVVVNVDRVRSMRASGFGEYAVHLRDGRKLTLTRGYREAFFQRLSGVRQEH
ncbi:MAG TPA: LytTR family DNA-binding domain-containing protein [Terriglobales bacterium]